MLDTVDSAKRLPAAPNDQERVPSESRVAPGSDLAGPRPAAGRPGVEPAVDERAGEGASACGEGDAATSWSSDWLQLSHELRTPLNAILGNIELLLDGSAGPLAAPVRACVGDIQAASRQLLGQLQPLLLLVQARTSGPLQTGLPIDLLALVRQAAADGAPGSSAPGFARRDAAWRREPRQPEGAGSAEAARLPQDTCLMVPGDPVWLGALAAAMVDLHAASAGAKGALSIDLEPSGVGAGGVVVRASWPELDPAATSPLPLALIDAVLALHGGRIRSLSADGLRLELPSAAMVQSSMSGRGRGRSAAPTA